MVLNNIHIPSLPIYPTLFWAGAHVCLGMRLVQSSLRGTTLEDIPHSVYSRHSLVSSHSIAMSRTKVTWWEGKEQSPSPAVQR